LRFACLVDAGARRIRPLGETEDDMSDTDPALVPDADPDLSLQRKIRRQEGEGPSLIPRPQDARKAGLLRKVEDSGA